MYWNARVTRAMLGSGTIEPKQSDVLKSYMMCSGIFIIRLNLNRVMYWNEAIADLADAGVD